MCLDQISLNDQLIRRLRYDPSAEGAIVFKPPTREHIQRFNKK